MKLFSLFIPLLFLLVFCYAIKKKVKLFPSFVEGIKEALPLLVSIFPYLAAVFILSELFESSHLSALFLKALSPVFRFLGIPPEISKLVLLKPFSGSGSLSLLSEIFSTYGPDSYLSRCAAAAYGSSETVFYISAVYFSKTKRKNLLRPVLISLIANFLAVILGCILCRFL